jgi:microcystin-dependent protein
VYQGASTFAQLGIGTAAQVLKVNSGATAPEWGQVATAGIADSAVTSAKIADGTIVLADLAAALQAFLVPVGTIAMYGGASAPTGWLLCDGTSTTGYTALAAIVGANTPDLRGRFAIGDNASLTLLGTGGSATIAEANLPSHTHANTATASTSVTVNSGGGHSHTASSGTAGAHSHTASTSSTGNHDHPQTVESTSITGDTHTHGTTGTAGNPDQTNSTGTDYTGSAGNHSHTVTVDEVVGHSHTVTVDEGGSHSHSTSATTTVTMSNASVGSGTAYYQPYLVVNYIIKHD